MTATPNTLYKLLLNALSLTIIKSYRQKVNKTQQWQAVRIRSLPVAIAILCRQFLCTKHNIMHHRQVTDHTTIGSCCHQYTGSVTKSSYATVVAVMLLVHTKFNITKTLISLLENLSFIYFAILRVKYRKKKKHISSNTNRHCSATAARK